MPSDFFLLPPSREKDQVEIRATVQAMNDFIKAYPESKYQEEAKKVLADARQRLAGVGLERLAGDQLVARDVAPGGLDADVVRHHRRRAAPTRS